MRLILVIIISLLLMACTEKGGAQKQVENVTAREERSLHNAADTAAKLAEKKLQQDANANQAKTEETLSSQALKKEQELEQELLNEAKQRNNQLLSELELSVNEDEPNTR